MLRKLKFGGPRRRDRPASLDAMTHKVEVVVKVEVGGGHSN
jgi:hypothetical protein